MNKIKNVINTLLIILISISSLTVAQASGKAKFSTAFIDFDYEANDYYGRGEEVIPNGSTFSPGQAFQVDFILETTGGMDIAGISILHTYDENVLEPIYYDSYDTFEPIEIKDNDFFPELSGRPAKYWGQSITRSPNNHSTWLMNFNQAETGKTIEETNSEKRMISLFYKVKEDAAPGSQFKISYDIGNKSNFSANGKNNWFEDGFIGEEAWGTVAGGTVEENNNLTDIKIKGSTSTHTYDYLVDFSEDTTSYNIVVPPSVNKLTFSHELEHSTSGTVVKHGKLSGPNGNSVSGFNLDVGDNYFKSVVSNSSGETVKEYTYTVKRLSNSTDFVLSGTDDNGHAVTFDSNKETVVRSDATSVDMNMTMNNGSEFEYELSSEEATISGDNITIIPNQTDTPFTVTFTPEDLLDKHNGVLGIDDERSEQITVDYKFTRASSDNSLKEVIVKNKKDNSKIHKWRTSENTYTLEVNNDVDKIALEIMTNHNDANIMTPGLDDISLIPGDNEIIVKVNAPDGSPKEYTFNIKRVPRKVAELSSLSIKVNGVEKNSPITTVNTTNNIELDYKKSYTLDIKGIANTDAGSKLLSGNINNATIGIGTHNYTLEVEAEDGKTQKVYYVNITVKENSESDLDGGLVVGPGLEDEILDDGIKDESTPRETDPENENIKIYRYKLNVKNSKKTFSMDDLDITLPEKSTLTGGSKIDLNVGDNTFTFDIKSQDGNSISRYILTVNRAKNDIASIKELNVTSSPQGTLSGSFDKGFTYKAPESVVKYTVTAEIDDGSVIDPDTIGTFDLTESNKEHIVKVTSEDGSDTKEYKVTIKRDKSSDATLSEFVISYGNVQDNDIIGSFVNQTYEINVGKDISEIDIVAKTTHPQATFTINHTNDTNFDLNYGKNSFNIEVRSETGNLASYTFFVNREKSDNADLSELRVHGSLVSGFNKDTLSYDIGTVDEYTTSLNITANAEDDNAKVEIIDNNLAYGKNTVTIKVTAQNGTTTKEYVIKVDRELSSSADLGEDGIIPNDPDGNHNIEPDPTEEYRYTVYVPYGTKTYGSSDFKLDIDSNAQAAYEQDPIDLDETRIFKFTVTSPNGKNTQDYIIDVVMMDSGVPHLEGAAINGTNVEPFDPDNYEPVIVLNGYLDEKDTLFEFSVNTADGIDVTYFNPIITVTGKTVIEQKVTLSNLSTGMTNTYIFKFTRSLTNDNTLDGLTVDKGTMTPSFDDDPEGPFVVDVDSDTESIEIDASLNNPNSSVEGDGVIDLVPGENDVTITVTPENGPDKDYEITINRPLGLDELKLGDTVVDVTSGSLSGDTLTYTITDPFDADLMKAYLHVVPNHSSVTIQGNVNTDIDLDNTDSNFTLVAQDGKTKLNVVVKYTRTLSDDVRLDELKSLVDGLVIKDFNPDTFVYEIEVEHDFLVLKRDDHLSWKTKHPNTTVTAIEELEISNTKENVYEIHTESESGKTGKYTLKITRGTYNYLDSLTIGDNRGHIEEQFNPEQLEYNALVYSGVERFSFEWTHQDGVKVNNATALKNISAETLPDTFIIEVEGDNGEKNEYKITVNRGVSTRLSNLNTSEGKIEFSPNVYEYDVYVAEDTEVVSLIDIVAEDNASILSGNYTNISLGGKTTTLSVKVSNSGYDSTYTVNFIRTKDLTEIKNIIAYDEDNIWHSVKKEDGSFEIIVDYGIDLNTLDYSVELVEKSGLYVISEPNKTDDAYEYVVSVTDKYGIKKDYDLIVKNDLSDNYYLESLTVDGKLVAGFNRYATSYNYPTYYSDDLVIEAIAEDENADVTISDFLDDNNGGYIDITVTSHKGSPNVYRLNFEKENIATLDNLSLKEAGISPDFNKDENRYYASVPYELDKVTVVYEFDHNGTVQVNGQENNIVSLNNGKNTIEVTVTAEDETTFVYTIEVTRNKKAENYLNSLEVKSLDKTYPLKPVFDKDTLVYNVKIDNTLESVTIDGTFDNRLIVTGLEDVSITGPITTHQVVVTENGVSRTYTINLIKEASNDATLKEIKYDVEKGKLTDLGDLIIFEVGNENTFEIEAIPTDPNATVSNDGKIDLIPGNNLVTIIVTAEDNVTKNEYKVLIKRDVILESVNIGGVDYSVTVDDYDKTVFALDDAIDPKAVKSKVIPTFNHPSVNYKGLENDLTFGKSGSFGVEVIPRSGDKQEIVVMYTREESSDATLGKLVVNNKEIPLVDGQFEYDIELPFNFEEFIKNNHLDATTTHPNASVSGKSQIEIKPDVDNEYIITVKAENGDTQEYTLKFRRADYDVGPSTLLESLSINHGELNFVSQNMVYEIKVNKEITEVIVSEIKPVDKNANVSSSYGISSETMTVPLVNDSTEAKITVTNGGYVTIYTLNFVKVEKQTGIKDITVNDGENIWKGEINDDGQYEVIVDNDTDLDDIEIDINTEFPNSSVEINGPIKDVEGNNHYEVIVTDENGTEEEFDLIIKKEKSNNAFLESLEIFDEGLIGFNKHTNEYTYIIRPDSTIGIDNIIAITENDDANVDITIEGDVITITVTAPNGEENVYNITIEIEEEKETILESLRLLETGISPKFNKNEAKYYASVPYEVEAVTVMYTSISNAVVEITASTTVNSESNVVSDLAIGTNEIKVKVSNGDVSYTYTIYVERNNKSETNFLDSLKVVDAEDESITYELTNSFDKDTLVYSVEVPYDVNSFKIKGDFEDGLMVSGLDMLIINEFPYIHKVRVSDEAGIVREYSITFIKAYSNESYLGNLSVSEGNLDPYFKKDTTSYNVDIGYETETIDIDYELGTEDQFVTGAGTHKLNVGRNTFEITVRSGNASTVYTVNVHRNDESPKLSDLSVSEGALSPIFDKNKYAYRVSVEKHINEIEIFAESKHTVKGDGVKTLVDGENIFEIEVINGSQSSYTYVIVYKESAESDKDDNFYEENLDLAYLDLVSDSLNETFNSGILEYTSNLIQPYYEELEVIAIPRNPNATVTVNGNKDLSNGKHIVEVIVSLQNGKSQTTTITVEVDHQILESEIHEIGEKYIATIFEKQTVLEVKNQMVNDNVYLKIFKDGEELSDDSLVGTGAIIKLIMNDKEYDSKTLIVLGDVNGDGEVSIPDRMQAQSYVLGNELTEAQMIAADVTRDRSIEINDVMLIQAHILELQDIFEMEEN